MKFLLLTRSSEYDIWRLLNNRVYRSLTDIFPVLEEYLSKNPTHETIVVQGETFSGRECIQAYFGSQAKKKGEEDESCS